MRHCQHCKGGRGRCACAHGCVRPGASICVAAPPSRHCGHCLGGGRGKCACAFGCARLPVSICRPWRQCGKCTKELVQFPGRPDSYAADSPVTCDGGCKRELVPGGAAVGPLGPLWHCKACSFDVCSSCFASLRPSAGASAFGLSSFGMLHRSSGRDGTY